MAHFIVEKFQKEPLTRLGLFGLTPRPEIKVLDAILIDSVFCEEILKDITAPYFVNVLLKHNTHNLCGIFKLSAVCMEASIYT